MKTTVLLFLVIVFMYVIFMTIIGVVLLPDSSNIAKLFRSNVNLNKIKSDKNVSSVVSASIPPSTVDVVNQVNQVNQVNRVDLQSTQPNVSSYDEIIGMPIYYINMLDSVDRKHKLEANVHHHHIDHMIHRVTAVNGRKLSNISDCTIDDQLSLACEFDTPSMPVLGCTLSHLKAIKEAFDNNLEKVLIVEDDVSFDLVPYWKKTIPTLIAELEIIDPNWHILSLFQHTIGKHNPPKFLKNVYMQGTVAYIINRKGMITIFEKLASENNRLSTKLSENLVADYFIYNVAENHYTYSNPLFFTHDVVSNRLGRIDQPSLDATDRILKFYAKEKTQT